MWSFVRVLGIGANLLGTLWLIITLKLEMSKRLFPSFEQVSKLVQAGRLALLL
jgi:hypothetical protein